MNGGISFATRKIAAGFYSCACGRRIPDLDHERESKRLANRQLWPEQPDHKCGGPINTSLSATGYLGHHGNGDVFIQRNHRC